jgi:23S rRNA (uracil1939-C5)-methyltransferase
MIKVNEMVIKALNDQGKGITYLNNKIVFVDNALPGEDAEIKVTKETSKYLLGTVTKYIKTSPQRVKPLCPYFAECGGCQLFNLNYAATIKYKEEKLMNILNKFANITYPVKVITNEHNLNYRNKITLKIKGGKVGYFKEKSQEIVEVKECLVASKAINAFIPYIPSFNILNGEVVIRSNYNDELLINFITDDPLILPKMPPLKIVGILKNGQILKGEDKFMELIDNHFYQISYDSFFQINPYITSKLFKIINEHIIPNSNVLDLYCGVGTLGLSLTSVKNLYGIEVVPNAIINALTNAKINQKPNAKYLLGDVSEVINKITDQIDVIIIDPPRVGLDKKTINTIIAIKPKQIIYVACDPITLARDLKELMVYYQIDYLTGLDMFSYSYHVECCSVLHHKIIE